MLFNDERYQRCNLSPGQQLFRYDHFDGDRLIGTVSGVVADGLLDCGHSAPFGGIDWVRRPESVGKIGALLDTTIAWGRAERIREIRIRARPAYFGANESAAEFALLNRGAVVESCEISVAIETGRYHAPSDYVTALDSAARNKLTQGLRAGLVFGPAETAADWAACYDLLAETKRRRGVQLKISQEYLLHLNNIFGSRIAMHRLTRDGELAAAALVYRIADSWDYLVAWGDDLRHRECKPVNVMAYHLVGEAIRRQIAILDLGISSVDGVADDGLIQFKRSIGGVTGLRLDFRMPLA